MAWDILDVWPSSFHADGLWLAVMQLPYADPLAPRGGNSVRIPSLLRFHGADVLHEWIPARSYTRCLPQSTGKLFACEATAPGLMWGESHMVACFCHNCTAAFRERCEYNERICFNTIQSVLRYQFLRARWAT